jgi:hypothetical protein
MTHSLSGFQDAYGHEQEGARVTRFHNLDRQRQRVSHRHMTNDYTDVIGEMRRMQDRLRVIRDRYCEPKSNANPRYLALSNAVSGLNKAIADMTAEDT